MMKAGNSIFEHEKPAEGASLEVVLYGRDSTLLSYRNEVLRWAGFATHTVELSTKNPEEIVCGPVVVLCHSLTLEDMRRITSALDAQCPATKVIAVTSSTVAIRPSEHLDATVESLAGPDSLIKAVKSLIETPQPAPGMPRAPDPASI